MKTNSKLVSALFISSLFLSASLVAQKSMSTADLDGSRKTQPLDTGVDTQPIEEGIQTQDLESRNQDSNYTRNALHLVIEAHDFTIRGGVAGEPCAILVGMELMAIPLPGGEELNIEPLAVLAQGEFNEFGEFSVRIGYDGKVVGGYTFHLQAISYEAESGKFWTSNVATLNFSDTGPAKMRAPGNDGTGGDTDGTKDNGLAKMRAPGNGGSGGDTDGTKDNGADGGPHGDVADGDEAGSDGESASSARGVVGDRSSSTYKKADAVELDDEAAGTHN
jgi:hypothetical protein